MATKRVRAIDLTTRSIPRHCSCGRRLKCHASLCYRCRLGRYPGAESNPRGIDPLREALIQMYQERAQRGEDLFQHQRH